MSDIYFDDVLYLQHYEVDITSDVVGTDWTPSTAGDGTVSQSTEQARYGTGCLKTTGSSSGNIGQINQSGDTTLDLTQPFTLEVSVFAGLTSSKGIFLQGGATDADRFQAYITTAGAISLFAATGGATIISVDSDPGTISADTWHDIAVTYDGTTITLYIDGQSEGTDTGFSAYVPTSDVFRWGWARQGAVAWSLNGYLDEMRITQVDRYGGLSYTPAAFPDTGPVATGDDKPLYLNTPTGNLNMQVQRGYGGIDLSTPTTGVTVTAGQWSLLPADTALMQNPLNVTQDFANSGIIVLTPGVWRLDVAVSCGFDPISNTARYLDLRLWNITQGTAPTAGTNITVEKNIEAFNFSTGNLFEITSVSGDLFGVQVGGASADFNDFTVDGYNLIATLVAEI